jgi:hypothetical protein
MLKGTFALELDGQEAAMIILALMDKADACTQPTTTKMYRQLAGKVGKSRQSFHDHTYQVMASTYQLPKLKEEQH